MAIIYNKNRKKGLFYIPSGGLGPSVSAEFAYGKAAYNQGEADPTPTITGTAGGFFTSDAGVSFIDTSTGQIDLSASTIATHAITYIVDGVQSTQNVGITAIPYQSTRSFSFDGVNDYFDLPYIDMGVNSTLSFWCFYTSNQSVVFADGSLYIVYFLGTSIYYRVGTILWSSVLTKNTWLHLAFVRNGDSVELFINNVSQGVKTGNGTVNTTKINRIAGRVHGSILPYGGNLDEVSMWDTNLSSDAITEIYNSGAPNDLESLTNASSSNLVAWYKMGE